jgi:hypothetical protein
MNKSLVENDAWPDGSMITQACHASTKSIWTFRNDPAVIEYTTNLDSMTKVTLQVKNEEKLIKLETELIENGIDVVRWIEMPENLLSCIATKPIRKSSMGTLLKKCSLYK